MHRPSTRSALCRLLSAGLLAACTACGGDIEPSARAGAAPQAAPVSVARPVEAMVTDTAEYTGRAESVESVEIRPRVSGYLERVAFREGDIVKRGDLLFVIDPRPYEAALARAKGALEQTKVDMGFADRDANRSHELVQKDAIPERQWDNDHSTLQRLLAAREVAEADVRTSALDVEYAFIHAPVSGRIGRVLVTKGNLVGPNETTPLATLVSVDPLYLYVDVEEARALHLARPHAADGGAAPAIARVGFAGEEGYPHEVTMDFVDNRVDETTGTIRVRFVVPNVGGRLTPGLFARVELAEGGPQRRLLISDRAVSTDQDRKFVYVVGGDNTAQYRGVQLGALHEGLRVVQGLMPDDRVIVRGLQRVKPGTPVAPTLVDMGSLDGPSPAPAEKQPQ
jgi:membrane fusion protein, multidrug efflux system